MKSRIRIRSLTRRKGTILAVSLVLISIAALGAILMTRTLLDHQSQNQRRRELARAFYSAEAGIVLVQHWGNFPSDFEDDELFQRIDFLVTSGGVINPGGQPVQGSGGGVTFVEILSDLALLFPNLDDRIGEDGFEISKEDLEDMQVGSFYSDHGYDVGHIERIEILPAIVAAGTTPHLFRIISTGESPDGIRRIIEAYITVNPLIALRLPAGLISFNTASTRGNVKMHWGEAWSKSDFDMLAMSQMDYVNSGDAGYDPLSIYRTEGQIDFPNNWKFDTAAPYNVDRLYDATIDQPGLFPDGTGNYRDAFYQNIPPGTLQWPDFTGLYQVFKDAAIAHGRYYTTDAAGNIYKNGVLVDFADEFAAPDEDGDGVGDRDGVPNDLAFIDTIDQQPPAADGSNLATIVVSGSGLALRGFYWIGANFDVAGVGIPPPLTVEDPYGNPVTLAKIFLDGVFFIAGTAEMAGNAGVYGSVVTQLGFTGAGTPDIYYNDRLSDGLILDNGDLGSDNLGSVFRVVQQSNYGTTQGS